MRMSYHERIVYEVENGLVNVNTDSTTDVIYDAILRDNHKRKIRN